jgi:hypothetical protein
MINQVRTCSLLAICQRDSENYYPFIGQTAVDIVRSVLAFFNVHIQNQFLSTDFIVDIYRKDSVCRSMYLSICTYISSLIGEIIHY